MTASYIYWGELVTNNNFFLGVNKWYKWGYYIYTYGQQLQIKLLFGAVQSTARSNKRIGSTCLTSTKHIFDASNRFSFLSSIDFLRENSISYPYISLQFRLSIVT
jgi:hypothetical protein